MNLKQLTELFEKSNCEKERPEFAKLAGSSVNKLDNTLRGLIKIIELSQASELQYKELVFADTLQLALSELEDRVKLRMHVQHMISATAPLLPILRFTWKAY